MIGSLMYLASATRSDISFAVSKLSRFTSNLGDDNWRALERVNGLQNSLFRVSCSTRGI
jgi:hypothetical protein